MPQSEDMKDLGGLARSIDTLFSGTGGDAPKPEVAQPERIDALEVEAARGDQASPEHEQEAPTGGGAEAAPLIELEEDTPPETMPAEPDLDSVSAPGVDSGSTSEAEALPDPEAHTLPAPEAEASAAPEDDASVESVGRSDENEVEASALEQAVELYLGGGGGVEELRTLAAQHLDDHDVDPVAGAVERLVLGAGDPEDPVTVELVDTV